MRALLLMTVLVATVGIPLWAARDPDARRGLRKTVVYTAIWSALFMLACAHLYQRLP